MKKDKQGLTRWIPPRGSLELREGLTIENLKNEPVKIRVRKTQEQVKENNLEGTEYERKEQLER